MANDCWSQLNHGLLCCCSSNTFLSTASDAFFVCYVSFSPLSSLFCNNAAILPWDVVHHFGPKLCELGGVLYLASRRFCDQTRCLCGPWALLTSFLFIFSWLMAHTNALSHIWSWTDDFILLAEAVKVWLVERGNFLVNH